MMACNITMNMAMYLITDRRMFSTAQVKLVLQAHSYQYDEQLRKQGFSPLHLRNLGLEYDLVCIGKVMDHMDIQLFRGEFNIPRHEYCLYEDHGTNGFGETKVSLKRFSINRHGRIVVSTMTLYSDIWNTYNEFGPIKTATISAGVLFDLAGARIFTFLCDEFDLPIEDFIDQI